jgi:hypothetical protein
VLYVEIVPLDPLLYPAHVTRAYGLTMLAVDETARRLDVAAFVADELTPEEQTILRTAYGVPPCGQSFDPEWLEGTVSPVVPESLTWPWLRTEARRDAA